VIKMEEKLITKAQKHEFIAKQARSYTGRAFLASQMSQPLRKFRDYTAVGRRAFKVDPLAKGIMPEYDLDPNVTAYVIAQEAGEFRCIFNDERVMVDLFTIASSPDISLTKMQRRQYDVEGRIKTKTEAEISRVEDKRIFDLFESICSNSSGTYKNVNMTAPADEATIEDFSQAIAQIEQWGDITTSNIFMNPAQHQILRRIGKDYFDPATASEINKKGFIGSIFGKAIHTSPEIPVDTVYFTGEPEYFGRLVVAHDLTVIPADTPKELKIGFSIFEEIGIFVHNENAVAKLTLTP
jgi:hypothetical protein